MLKAHGVRTIIASDYSAGRRELAKRCGAHIVVDPARESPYRDWKEFGFIGSMPGLFELSVGTREARQAATALAPCVAARRDCGSRPQAPDRIRMCRRARRAQQHYGERAVLHSRRRRRGLHAARHDRALMGINKEIELRFVLAYSPLEFRDALHMIAEGKVDCARIVTGTVGLHGVEAAFEALKDPERHAKILIDSASATTSPDTTAVLRSTPARKPALATL
jgi:threonine dehydrogenase-like Zn-dependent dehydrogenase